MKSLLAIAALLLAGCTTTATTFQENGRTMFYVSCIQNNFEVTTCQCLESTVVEATGVTDLLQAPTPELETKFQDALGKAVESCTAEKATK